MCENWNVLWEPLRGKRQFGGWKQVTTHDSWFEPREQAAMLTVKAYREGKGLTSGWYLSLKNVYA